MVLATVNFDKRCDNHQVKINVVPHLQQHCHGVFPVVVAVVALAVIHIDTATTYFTFGVSCVVVLQITTDFCSSQFSPPLCEFIFYFLLLSFPIRSQQILSLSPFFVVHEQNLAMVDVKIWYNKHNRNVDHLTGLTGAFNHYTLVTIIPVHAPLHTVYRYTRAPASPN
jgi:type IV secretory pathway VirB2 component (pilin)